MRKEKTNPLQGFIDVIKDEVEEKKEKEEKRENTVSIDPLPKTYDEITSSMSIEIPFNTIKPVNQRIFAIEINPSEQKTEKGIIIPTKFSLSEAKGGRTRNIKRYFVVDIADDCILPIKRGMEIHPFYPNEAEEWTFPEVYDWGNGRRYITFHQTEIHGISMAEIEEIKSN